MKARHASYRWHWPECSEARRPARLWKALGVCQIISQAVNRTMRQNNAEAMLARTNPVAVHIGRTLPRMISTSLDRPPDRASSATIWPINVLSGLPGSNNSQRREQAPRSPCRQCSQVEMPVSGCFITEAGQNHRDCVITTESLLLHLIGHFIP